MRRALQRRQLEAWRASAGALHTAVLSWGMGSQARGVAPALPFRHSRSRCCCCQARLSCGAAARRGSHRWRTFCNPRVTMCMCRDHLFSLGTFHAFFASQCSTRATVQGALGIQSTTDQHEPGAPLPSVYSPALLPPSLLPTYNAQSCPVAYVLPCLARLRMPPSPRTQTG